MYDKIKALRRVLFLASSVCKAAIGRESNSVMLIAD